MVSRIMAPKDVHVQPRNLCLWYLTRKRNEGCRRKEAVNQETLGWEIILISVSPK